MLDSYVEDQQILQYYILTSNELEIQSINSDAWAGTVLRLQNICCVTQFNKNESKFLMYSAHLADESLPLPSEKST